MSFLNKNFAYEKEENFKGFVDSLDIPDDKRELLLNYKPSCCLKKEGDEYILSAILPDGSSKDLKFKDGVEFDEEVSSGIVAKSKFDVEGNSVVQNQKFDDLCIVYKREFSDDGLVVEISSNKWDGIARRYYKAV